MHSIFITNGLGICGARRLADLWQAGLLHFITASQIDWVRERQPLWPHPLSQHAAGQEGTRPVSRRGDLIWFCWFTGCPGRFHSCVFQIRFPTHRVARCLFADYLCWVLKWHLFASCHWWLTSGDCTLALDCYAASSWWQVGFWRLSKEPFVVGAVHLCRFAIVLLM